MTANEVRKVNIDFNTARQFYKSDNFTLKGIALVAFKKEELEALDNVETWYDLLEIEGYKIDSDSTYYKVKKKPLNPMDTAIFRTLKQVKSAIAMAQISQLLPVYNEGWEPDWNSSEYKYLYAHIPGGEIFVTSTLYRIDALCFKSEKIAREFLNNNEELIKEYLML